MVANSLYSVKDIKGLYKKHIVPIKKNKLSGKALHERFINYILGVCESLALPYQKKEDDVFIDARSYGIIELFYINQEKYLRGDLELISYHEVLKIFEISFGNFNVANIKKNKKPRKNWLDFIKLVPPSAYMNSVFWFSKEKVQEFKNSLGSVYLTKEDIQVELLEKHNINWRIGKIMKRLLRIEDKKVIDFMGRIFYYHKDVINELVKFPIPESDLYMNCLKAGELLGLTDNTIRKHAFDQKMFPGTQVVYGENNNFRIYVLKEEVNKWQEFKTRTVPLIEIVADVLKELGYQIPEACSINLSKIEAVESQYENILRYVETEETDFEVIDSNTTPFRTFSKIVNREDIEKAKEYVKRKIIYLEEYRKGKKGTGPKYKFISYMENNRNKNNKLQKTINYFYEFAFKRFEDKSHPSFQTLKTIHELISSLQKELMKHDDDEINVLFKNLDTVKTSNKTIEEFCRFLHEIKNKFKTQFKKKYLYDYGSKGKKGREEKFYTEEQFFNFAVLLLNNTHKWYEEYIEKACSSRASASAWLYCLIHYICAWRKSDILNKIPFPMLPFDQSTNKEMTPDQYFTLARQGKITEEMALQIVQDVTMKINILKPKPTKTEKHNPPGLVWDVPTSVVHRIGFLLGLCEAHRRSNTIAPNRLITTTGTIKVHQEKFFGQPLCEIFKSGVFSSNAANKTYLSLIAKKGDERKLGSGHILASIARSHKFDKGKKSNITSVYLKYFGKLTDSDILLRELFERGVLSFVPYLLLKTLKGDDHVKQLPPSKQTTLMKELIPYSDSPYDADMWVKTFDDTFTKARKDVEGIKKYYSINGEPDVRAIHLFIDRIACGTAPAKEKNMNCIAVAKGIGCINPERETCIGCGQELYLKHTMYLLGQKLRERIKKLEESKTPAEQMKHEMIYEQVYEPILNDIKQTLVEVYGLKPFDINRYLDLTDEPVNPNL